jgi:thioredoxin 2
LLEKARCAACKASLLPLSHPLEVSSKADFDEMMRDAPTQVLVDFWAPWCGPCRAAAPEVERLAQSRVGRLVTAKVDTEALPEVARQFAIRTIPTMILLRGGHELGRVSGAMPAEAIAARLSIDVG